jgi:hypothetical protein
MSVTDIIISTPFDAKPRLKNGAQPDSLTDPVFVNFMDYARKRWHYSASRNLPGPDALALLAGTGNIAACQGFAYTLGRVFKDGLGIVQDHVHYPEIKGYFWVAPRYKCFDPLVKGNIRKLHRFRKVYDQGTIFKDHMYLQCYARYYDPTVGRIYGVKDELVHETFPTQWDVSTPNNQAHGSYIDFADGRKLLITRDQQTLFLSKDDEAVHGFHRIFLMFEPSEENFKRAFGKLLKKDLQPVNPGDQVLSQFVLHCFNAPVTPQRTIGPLFH